MYYDERIQRRVSEEFDENRCERMFLSSENKHKMNRRLKQPLAGS